MYSCCASALDRAILNQVLFDLRLYLATEIINQAEKCGNIVRRGHLRSLFHLDNLTVTEDAHACNPYPELALFYQDEHDSLSDFYFDLGGSVLIVFIGRRNFSEESTRTDWQSFAQRIVFPIVKIYDISEIVFSEN